MLPETSIQLLDIPKKDLCRIRFPKKENFFTTEVKEYIYSLERFGDTGDSYLLRTNSSPRIGKMYFQDFRVK